MRNKKFTMKMCRLFSLLALILVSMLTLSTCIQPESLNAECDIISAELKGKATIQAPLIENDSITFLVADSENIGALSLTDVMLTPGATIIPNPSIVQDFSKPVTYTVTSEDGEWEKLYTVSVLVAGLPTDFSFETYEIVYRTVFGKKVPSYDVFYEYYDSQKLDIWASGNPGYRLSNGTAKPAQYPTSAALGEGYDAIGTVGVGIAAKLVTLSTGFFGNLVGMPIAAGSLYLGTFDVSSATTNALGATKFGIPFNLKPKSIEGFYRYEAGEELKDKEGKILDVKDEPDIYAVLYKPKDGEFLDGSNILTSEQIVAVARVEKDTKDWPTPTTKYSDFSADFNYAYKSVVNGVSSDNTINFDPEVASNFGYNITIVFTSSKDGAKFQGALGSTLYLDKVKLNAEVPK